MYSCSCKLEEENCDISLHKLSWGLFCLIIIFFMWFILIVAVGDRK